jgi:hypothetical protein
LRSSSSASARPGAGIFGREAGDAARLLDGLRNGPGAQIRAARRGLALSEIDRHAEGTIALVLERLDLAQTHVDRKTRIDADARFRLRRAARLRFLEDAGDERFELGSGRREVGYGRRHGGGDSSRHAEMPPRVRPRIPVFSSTSEPRRAFHYNSRPWQTLAGGA